VLIAIVTLLVMGNTIMDMEEIDELTEENESLQHELNLIKNQK
jgi:hypothetical protein